MPSKNGRVIERFFVLCIALGLASGAWAETVSSDMARKAASKWLTSRPQAHMGARMNRAVKSVDTCNDGQGGTLFHVATLEGGGYVVMAADNRIMPVVAFSDKGSLDRDENNPLWAMLNRDLPDRLAILDRVVKEVKAGSSGSSVSGGASMSLAESMWVDLLDDSVKAGSGGDADEGAKAGVGMSDLNVRVSPLLTTRWSQREDGSGRPCYSLYTPNGYYCGCTATACAQVMRYHEWPTAGHYVTPVGRMCQVDEVETYREMLGGYYDWSLMPDAPDGGSTDAQRQAIGRLCYDVGVVVRSNWTPTGTGGKFWVLQEELKSVFGYANATLLYPEGGMTDADFRRVIYANLDARAPVMLAIEAADGGAAHAVVADGYGHCDGCWVTHVNFGWGGGSDAWYALPDIGTDYHYAVVYLALYNIFPAERGSLLTGRVLKSNGEPVPSAVVTATSGEMSVTGITDQRGIYALHVDGDRTWNVRANSGTASRVISVFVKSAQENDSAGIKDGSSYWGYNSSGNSWGNDIALGDVVEERIDMVAHYKFDGDAADSSGNGNDGMVCGATPCSDRFGNLGKAMQFDGDDFICVANSPTLESVSQSVTISAWIKSSSVVDWYVVCKGKSSRQFGLFTGYYDTGNWFIDDARGIGARCDASLVQRGQWTHVAMTYDGTVAKTYVNGMLAAQRSCSQALAVNSEDMYIGSDPPGNLEYFTGAIDDLRIYNVVLSPEAIAKLHAENAYTTRFSDGREAVYERSYFVNSVYNLPKNAFVNGAKRFAGWACSNGRRYDDGMLVFDLAKPGETVTMTAIWE